MHFGKKRNMIDVLCFNCGSMFAVPSVINNPTKHCPTCKDKLK